MNDAVGPDPDDRARDGLEGRLRTVILGSVDGLVLHPDEGDVRRRMRVRARRRRVGIAAVSASLVAAALTGLALARTSPHRAPIADAASSVPGRLPAPTTAVPCAPPAALPFQPTLPAGWTRTPYDVTDRSGVPQIWWRPDHSPVEIWNGVRADLPEPSPTEPLTALGRTAAIGPISDGFSMVVQLGPTPCDRWALVAHPGIDQAELRTIAEGLRPADAASSSSTAPDRASLDRVLMEAGSNLVEKRTDGSKVVLAPLPPGSAEGERLLVDAGDRMVAVADGRVYVYDTAAWGPPVDVGPVSGGLGIGVVPSVGFWSADATSGSLADGPTAVTVTWRLRGWDGRGLGPSIEIDRRDAQPIGATADGVFFSIMATAHVRFVTSSQETDFGACELVATRGHLVACHRVGDGAYVVVDGPSAAVTVIGTVGGLGLQAGVGAASFSPDGRYLSIGRLSVPGSAAVPSTLIVDVSDPSDVRELAATDGSGGVHWSGDGSRLLTVAAPRIESDDTVTRSPSAQWIDVASGRADAARFEVSLPVVLAAG